MVWWFVPSVGRGTVGYLKKGLIELLREVFMCWIGRYDWTIRE